MPLVEIDFHDAFQEAFGGDVSDNEYLFEDDGDGNDDDGEEFPEAEQEQASPSDDDDKEEQTSSNDDGDDEEQTSSEQEPQDWEDLPLTADQLFNDKNEAEHDTLQTEHVPEAEQDIPDVEEQVPSTPGQLFNNKSDAEEEVPLTPGKLFDHEDMADEEVPSTAGQLIDDGDEAAGDIPETVALVDENNDGLEDEALSHFSNSSSDEDGWNADDELRDFRATTEAMNQRRSVDQSPGEASGDLNAERVAEEQEDASDEAYFDSIDQNSEHIVLQDNIEPNAEEEPVVYEIDENKKPWLHNAHLNGALLPMAGWGDDDLYRQNARFFHTGSRDMRRGATPLGYFRVKPTKPTNMSIDGVVKRITNQRNEAWHESGELKSELAENAEQIGMLKHAVDTRDARENQFKEWVELWKQHAEHWQKAFEDQEPLAKAERERQMMFEAGVEVQRSVETQTSPIEEHTAVELRIPDSAQSIHIATQTDKDIPDPEDSGDMLRLTLERDDLLEENRELSDQTRRLRSLLEDWKELIETKAWVPRESIEKEKVDACDMSLPKLIMSRNSSDGSTPESNNDFSDATDPFDWSEQDRPRRWLEREKALRNSNSWAKARDLYAAQLNAWEKQFWASANAEAAVCG